MKWPSSVALCWVEVVCIVVRVFCHPIYLRKKKRGKNTAKTWDRRVYNKQNTTVINIYNNNMQQSNNINKTNPPQKWQGQDFSWRPWCRGKEGRPRCTSHGCNGPDQVWSEPTKQDERYWSNNAWNVANLVSTLSVNIPTIICITL